MFWINLSLFLSVLSIGCFLLGWFFWRSIAKFKLRGGGVSGHKDSAIVLLIVVLLLPLFLITYFTARLHRYIRRKKEARRYFEKYRVLWQYVKERGEEETTLTYEQIKQIADFDVDILFRMSRGGSKKYGYKTVGISYSNKTVRFRRISK